MTEITQFPYAGQDVRVVVDEHGDPWFVANDVAGVLGVQNIRQVVAGLDEDDVSTAYVTDALGRDQRTSTVNEPGLYALIFQSRKQEAKAFQRWVTHDVLPQIRRTGSFGQVKELSRSDLARMVLDAEAELEQAKTAVAELEPRAEAWDVFLDTAADYKVADAAKMLARDGIDVGQNRLFDVLHTFGWIYRGSQGKWEARQTAVNSGYLVHKPQSHHHPRTGALVADPPQVRVTVKGLQRLKERLSLRTPASVARALEEVDRADGVAALEVLRRAADGGPVSAADLDLVVSLPGGLRKQLRDIGEEDLGHLFLGEQLSWDQVFRLLNNSLVDGCDTFGAAFEAGGFPATADRVVV